MTPPPPSQPTAGRAARPSPFLSLQRALHHGEQTGVVELPDVGRFLMVAAQLALVLLAIHAFRLEESFGFVRILPLLFVGFVINAVLPMALRRSFFVLLSLAAILSVFGVEYGTGLIVLGLGLIALCHLPIPFAARVTLLVALGAVFAGMRAGWIPTPFGRMPLLPVMVLPILGSMFMFRLVVYLYDIRHETQPAPLSARLGYFFLLPNVCFPLFPVVDYRTYLRTYYDRPAAEIYEKGLRWIFRGMLHLLLYRVVYLFFVPTQAEVQTLGGVVQAMLTTYLLYLRISGQFHLIVGILCLFGFNLPETHHLYFLASSFNDYWRRINIYWKDFMMKIFYYPSLMRAKKLGFNVAMVIATAAVFLGTWLLHSYQWFWLRGSFPLRLTDALFWGTLGTLVVVNSLYEARRGRRRTLGESRWALRPAVMLSFRTVAMFVTITVLWSLWSSASVEDWLAMVAVAGRAQAWEVAALVLALAGLVVLGVLLQYVVSRKWLPSPPPGERPPLWSAVLVGATAVVLILIGTPDIRPVLADPVEDAVLAVRENRMNRRDAELMERGYYEGLLDAGSFANAIETVQALAQRPDNWGGSGRGSRATRERDDLLEYEMVPNYDETVKLAPFHTNRWGMRDRDYEQIEPAGVFRIALLGSSYEVGAGVPGDSVYENVVEDRLNRESAGSGQKYEILNFSVAGYSLLHNYLLARTNVFEFDPDLLVLAGHSQEIGARLRTHLRIAIEKGLPINDPELREIIARSGAFDAGSAAAIERSLQTVLVDVARWSFQGMAELCREHGIPCVWLFVPTTDEVNGSPPTPVDRLEQLAAEAGFITYTLEGAYGDYAETEVYLGPWDGHPNELGHRLLADRLYQILRSDPRLLAPPGARAGSANHLE